MQVVRLQVQVHGQSLGEHPEETVIPEFHSLNFNIFMPFLVGTD